MAGLHIVANYRVLLLVAAFVAICERSMTVIGAVSGMTPGDIRLRCTVISQALVRDPSQVPNLVESDRLLVVVLATAVCLFILGAFLLAGVLGVMRDVLITNHYEPTTLLQRSSTWFWPMFRFKFPIYSVLGAATLIVGAMISTRSWREIVTTPTFLVVVSLWAAVLFVGQILLSLGAKVIIAANVRHFGTICRTVFVFLKKHYPQIVLLYVILLSLAVFTLMLPVLLGRMGTSPVLITLITITAAAFVTVFTKAAAFHFYLQLRAQEAPAKSPAPAAAPGVR